MTVVWLYYGAGVGAGASANEHDFDNDDNGDTGDVRQCDQW